MCLGIAMKVVEVHDDGLYGTVAAEGVRRPCFFHMIEKPEIGDYVIVHAGCAIEKIDEKKAKENMELLTTLLFGDDDES